MNTKKKTQANKKINKYIYIYNSILNLISLIDLNTFMFLFTNLNSLNPKSKQNYHCDQQHAILYPV